MELICNQPTYTKCSAVDDLKHETEQTIRLRSDELLDNSCLYVSYLLVLKFIAVVIGLELD